MCGIFAAFNINSKTNINFLKKLNDVASHRGPDSSNIFVKNNCFLGHRRLSIIDLNNRSNQPLKFKNKTIIYNGEIFNYVEIKNKLIEVGYTFSTASDTEVIIKAYDYWGDDCQNQFNGMWSFVIYDEIKKTLFISRDRFGQKPLYYLLLDNVYYFASEVQQLTYLKKTPNYEVIQKFLKEGGYESNGETFFENIFEFPKAHSALINEKNQVNTKRYWDYPIEDNKKVDKNVYAEFNNLLDDSIKLRTRSDVDIGVLLSGGIDSTILIFTAQKYLNNKKKTIAVNYSSENLNDEKIYAKKIAEKLNLNFYSFTQDIEPNKYISRLKNIVRHLGRGHSSPAVVSTDYLYEVLSKKNIKVALDGQGADELLAGYKNYHFVLLFEYFINLEFKNIYFLILDWFKDGFLNSTIICLRIILPEQLKKIGRWFYGYEKFFVTYKKNKRNVQTIKMIRSKYIPLNYLNRYLKKQHTIGLENLLFYGDIIAMKNSIENRSPFMDHRLVEFSFSRNHELKVNKSINKYVLRKNKGYLKFKNLLNRKKVGFDSKIRKNTKSLMIKKILNSKILEMPIFSKKIKENFVKGLFTKDKYEEILFRIFQIYLWNDIFLDKKKTNIL
jgi:asparagine synthase (glutamine-hydrolysing)